MIILLHLIVKIDFNNFSVFLDFFLLFESDLSQDEMNDIISLARFLHQLVTVNFNLHSKIKIDELIYFQ